MPRVKTASLLRVRSGAERVTNIILSNITPPLFPEIQVCLNEDGTLTVLVIRIPESHQTPHAIAKSTEVYLRTGNRNTPEKLATIGEIEWLQDRRRRSEGLRETLYKLAHDRFVRLYRRNLYEAQANEREVEEVTEGWLTLSLCPLYPKEPLRAPPELDKIRHQIGVREYGADGGLFPLPYNKGSRIVQDGIVFQDLNDEGRVYHTELNGFGLFYYRQTVAQQFQGDSVIPASTLFCRLDEFLDAAANFYKEIGYWGTLQFTADLRPISGSVLGPYESRPRKALSTLESEVRFVDIVRSATLPDEKPRLILDAAQRFAWAFGWNVTSQLLEGYYQKHKG